MSLRMTCLLDAGRMNIKPLGTPPSIQSFPFQNYSQIMEARELEENKHSLNENDKTKKEDNATEVTENMTYKKKKTTYRRVKKGRTTTITRTPKKTTRKKRR